MSQIKRALISVSDKTGIVELGKQLAELGIEIVSTGGTFRALQSAGVPVTSISDLTQFPEILDGRVKTLHPAVHGGLLAIRDQESHQQQMKENNIEPIDLVIVNLYPFAQTIAELEVTMEEAIENIDIGGPSMLRSSAKNHRDVTVVVDPSDYGKVIEQLQAKGETELKTRFALAAKAFRHTASYDSMIANYFLEQQGGEFPERLTVTFEKHQTLRYGENPHQQAAFYREPFSSSSDLAGAKQLQGKELSYNNINDANAALELINEFSEPSVVAVKHMNPCGVGVGSNLLDAYQQAYQADPVSIFGGIVATNCVVDEAAAKQMKEIFLEIILAPGFEPAALEILQAKKNLRLLQIDPASSDRSSLKLVSVNGGLLVQEKDQKQLDPTDCQVVTKRNPSEDEWKQLLFTWKVVKHVKSNAIVLGSDSHTVGIGAGQMNRVGAAEIAIKQAGDKAIGAVMASDAFFPMKDTVQKAAEAGIKAIIQPGGSIRDTESIEEADRHGIAMVFTGVRHFKH